ncbi:MAG: lipoprotein 17-related variable surface protein [Mycoplasmoidaceae bacterium]
MKKRNNIKYKLITSLSLLSSISIVGASLLNNTSPYSITNSFENGEVLNQVDSRVYTDNYKSIYHTRYNAPVISSDPNNPGFLGVVQPINGSTDYPTQITWTGNNLYNSWSQDVTKHPDILKYKGTSSEFAKPIILGAHHLDDIKTTTNFTNQILIIVGDEQNLNAKRYAFVRYDTVLGQPISNPGNGTVIVPPQTYGFVPTKDQAHAFTITYHAVLNKWLVYYPGLMRMVKEDIFMFTIDDNKMNFHDKNSTHLEGIASWPNGSYANFFSLNNFWMSISAGDRINEWSIMFKRNAEATENANKIGAFNLEANFSPISNWVTLQESTWARSENVVEGVTDSDGHIILPNAASFEPYMVPIQYKSIGGGNTLSIFMVLPIKTGNNFIYVKPTLNLSRKSQGRYYVNSYQRFISLSNLISTSATDPSKRLRPTSWVNPKDNRELIITYQTSENLNIYTKKFRFGSTGSSGVPNLIVSQFDLQQNTYGTGTIRPWNSITIEDYFNKDLYIFSGDNNLSNSSLITNNGEVFNNLTTLYTGGITFKDPLLSAQTNGFLASGSNAKLPSQINLGDPGVDNGLLMYNGPLSSNIADPGWGQKYLLNRNIENVNLSTGSLASIPLTIEPNLVQDDTNGIISGNVNITLRPLIGGKTLNLSSTFSFNVSGFKTSNTPTELVVNDASVIRSTFASSINLNNVANYFSLNNVPASVRPEQLTWQVLNPNNRTGYLKINVTTPAYIDENTILQNTPKTFEIEINGINFNGLTFQRITGTILERSDQLLDTLTVWDFSEELVPNYVNIVNVVPGQEVFATYTISNIKPLEGKLTVNAQITGGYFAGANALPATDPNIPLSLNIVLEGFNQIAGATSFNQLPSDPQISPYVFVDTPSLLLSYVTIINAVPNATTTITDVEASDAGTVIANLNFSQAYNSEGMIVPGTPQRLTFSGFKIGIETKNTEILSIPNALESSKIFPIELDSENVTKFVTVVNLPPETEVQYNIISTNNTSPSINGGSARVSATVNQFYDELGNIVNLNRTFELPKPIYGFKSVQGPTTVSPSFGNANIYPQFFDPLNADQFLSIRNGSPVSGKESSVQILSANSSYDNSRGTLSISYKLTNFFNSAGEFIRSTTTSSFIQIDGFKKVSGITTLALKSNAPDINEILPSEFNEKEWEKYFQIINLSSNSVVPPDGPTVTKISSNDENGTIKLRVDGILNFVDSKYDITSSGTFDVEIKGFLISKTDNTLMFTIIGSSIGGFIILVLIIGILMWMRINKKNKDLLNTKKPPTSATSSTPTAGPSMTRAVPPVGPRPPVGPPMAGPTMTRAVPPVGPTPPPMGGSSGRPTPPPRK